MGEKKIKYPYYKGERLKGTFERCEGIARVACVEFEADGSNAKEPHIEWAGDTDFLYDTQETVRDPNGSRLWVTDDGDVIPEFLVEWLDEEDAK